MPYFVVISEQVADPSETAKYREQHYKYIEKLKNEGKVVMSGPFVDGSGGLIILEASSRDEAESIVSEDPYFKSGVRRYTIKEWRRVY